MYSDTHTKMLIRYIYPRSAISRLSKSPSEEHLAIFLVRSSIFAPQLAGKSIASQTVPM